MSEPRAKIVGHRIGTPRPWQIEFVLTNAESANVWRAYSAAFMNQPPA